MSAHTPGPWWVSNLGHSPWSNALAIGYGPDKRGAYADSGIIAYTTRGFEDGPSWANAHLIAASPELLDHVRNQHSVIDTLLAMLIECDHAFMPTKQPFWPTIAATRDIIAKATGESK